VISISETLHLSINRRARFQRLNSARRTWSHTWRPTWNTKPSRRSMSESTRTARLSRVLLTWCANCDAQSERR